MTDDEKLEVVRVALAVKPTTATVPLVFSTMGNFSYEERAKTYRFDLHQGDIVRWTGDFIGLGPSPARAVADAYRQLSQHWARIAGVKLAGME